MGCHINLLERKWRRWQKRCHRCQGHSVQGDLSLSVDNASVQRTAGELWALGNVSRGHDRTVATVSCGHLSMTPVCDDKYQSQTGVDRCTRLHPHWPVHFIQLPPPTVGHTGDSLLNSLLNRTNSWMIQYLHTNGYSLVIESIYKTVLWASCNKCSPWDLCASNKYFVAAQTYLCRYILLPECGHDEYQLLK